MPKFTTQSPVVEQSSMASADEFKGAVKRLMQQSGSLDIVQAQVQFKYSQVWLRLVLPCRAELVQVRAEILKAICSGEAPRLSRDGEPETVLINELIREYLGFQGYDAAASVFIKEARLNDQGLPRACMEVNVASCTEQESRLPLLYVLLRRTQISRAETRQAVTSVAAKY